MKLHANTTRAVVDNLRKIFAEKKYADKVIEKALKENPKWGARDRRFIAETTYDVVRWQRKLQALARCGPDDYWSLMGTLLLLKEGTLPDWEEFSPLNKNKKKILGAPEPADRSVAQSIPAWLDELGEQELGHIWEKELKALNEEAAVVLRTNTLKISRAELARLLHEEGIATFTSEQFPDALILRERQNVFNLPAFKAGMFDIQDAASQLIAPFMQVKPGMRVIDACAGAGGKTLHLAALMRNQGRLLAMDVEQWKLDELSRRARRAGITNLETRLIDGTKAVKRLHETADRLLLDVPCSGLGVLRRNPDAKWKLTPEFIEKVKALQKQILNDYSRMVKPGGELVYATCSILYSENEHQVESFLAGNPTFVKVEERRTWPSEGFDGFYMARLKRLPTANAS